MKRIIILSICVLIFASCGKKNVFDEQRTFANNNWQRFSTESFEVPIRNIDDCYHLYMDLVIDTAFFCENLLPLTININGPDGSNRMFYGYVRVRDNGRWQGTFEGGNLHVSQRVRQYFFFNTKGTHEVVIGQATSHYDLYGIVSAGLRIEKAELNFPK
ncbi:MAG: gliding motility lipoprotein GldH [Bacteroidales bacterium]|nr:gliding motility lipoprotein GldH [Bacteroidales bacterium]